MNPQGASGVDLLHTVKTCGVAPGRLFSARGELPIEEFVCLRDGRLFSAARTVDMSSC